MKTRSLKILFCGDSPTTWTGFSKCTRELCNRLHTSGHDISVLGVCEYGDPHSFPYPIYPAINPLDHSFMPWGEQRLPKMIAKLKPDVVIILQDAWNIRGYIKEINDQLTIPCDCLVVGRMNQPDLPYPRSIAPPDLKGCLANQDCLSCSGTGMKWGLDFPKPLLIGWLSVDTKNQPSGRECNALDHAVVWTQFAIDQLSKGGYTGQHSIIGLGVDTNVYYPVDRSIARKSVTSDGIRLLPDEFQDYFIIGLIARNQFRKRFDLALEYFAEWTKSYGIDDALLYFHANMTREMGTDIKSLCRYYGIKVIVSECQLGKSLAEDEMRMLYNLVDLHWSMSQSEGWNLPALESMACAVPVLLPDQGGPSSWAKEAAYLVPCTSTAINAPINQALYTIGEIADKHLTIEALETLYRSPNRRHKLRTAGLDLARSLSWDRVGEQFESLLQSLSTRSHPTMTDLMVTPEAIDEFLEADRFAGSLT